MRRTTVTHRLRDLVVLAVSSTVALVVAASPAGALVLFAALVGLTFGVLFAMDRVRRRRQEEQEQQR